MPTTPELIVATLIALALVAPTFGSTVDPGVPSLLLSTFRRQLAADILPCIPAAEEAARNLIASHSPTGAAEGARERITTLDCQIRESLDRVFADLETRLAPYADLSPSLDQLRDLAAEWRQDGFLAADGRTLSDRVLANRLATCRFRASLAVFLADEALADLAETTTAPSAS